jgi:two-component system alkaline phosphatase synthesis response regulator PhoP
MSQPTGQPKTIWVVDDDVMILDAVRLVLEGERYHVETSLDGAPIRALGAGAQALPDLILLDVLLAGEDGLDLCRLVKTRLETRHIPVVLFSADSRVGPQVAGVCGDDYLPKPFDIDTLVELVHRHIGA